MNSCALCGYRGNNKVHLEPGDAKMCGRQATPMTAEEVELPLGWGVKVFDPEDLAPEGDPDLDCTGEDDDGS